MSHSLGDRQACCATRCRAPSRPQCMGTFSPRWAGRGNRASGWGLMGTGVRLGVGVGRSQPATRGPPTVGDSLPRSVPPLTQTHPHPTPSTPWTRIWAPLARPRCCETDHGPVTSRTTELGRRACSRVSGPRPARSAARGPGLPPSVPPPRLRVSAAQAPAFLSRPHAPWGLSHGAGGPCGQCRPVSLFVG